VPKGTWPAKKGTFPPRSTTTKAPPVTKAPPPTKAPPTTKPKPVPTTQPVEVKVFCDYAKTLQANLVDSPDFVATFNQIYDALVQGEQLAPASIRQAVSDLRAAFAAVKPAVDAGEITTNDQLTVWFATQDAETQSRIRAALKATQIYTTANCK